MVIRDQVKEILELVPAVPRVHKLAHSLRGREYEGPEEESQIDIPKFTLQNAKEEVQASDVELMQGLKEARILNINGELRPISQVYLASILELILNLLVSLSLPPNAVSVETLTSVLADEHEVPRPVSTQVMAWFGEIRGGKWNMDVKEMVMEAGLGILRNHKDEPVEKEVLLAKWASIVGDTFENSISLDLLAGNYLLTPGNAPTLSYFPRSSLPVDPSARFRDLFLTRTRWKVEDITPFLSDIAVDTKERDKLLLKYARGVTDAGGLWYTARAQYSA
ncbi:hypothetical protein BDN72DRAFT_831276 [Pluteus cervinus]|uniref:Uncharacterized protein n=1 Tax=Pluteus cervinus TaxID=181527 RepID=A0ACD3BFN4_9AGAR|nr:hypothetical protein BDN72DRAFT_831276 [Pluteus cervinus]